MDNSLLSILIEEDRCIKDICHAKEAISRIQHEMAQINAIPIECDTKNVDLKIRADTLTAWLNDKATTEQQLVTVQNKLREYLSELFRKED